jgi:hypothetical protein
MVVKSLAVVMASVVLISCGGTEPGGPRSSDVDAEPRGATVERVLAEQP